MTAARTITPAGDRLASNLDRLRPQWAAVRAVVAAIDGLSTAGAVDLDLIKLALDRLRDRSEPDEHDCDACGGDGRRDGYVCRECGGEGVAA